MSPSFLLVADHTPSAQDAAAVLGELGEWHIQLTRTSREDSPRDETSPTARIQAAVIPMSLVRHRERLLPRDVVWLAYGSAVDIVRGFFLGAQDYLVDPWTAGEAIARCQRAVRHPGYSGSGGIEDELGQVLVTENRTIVLTARETALWGLLRRHAGRVVDRSTIAAILGLRIEDRGRSRAIDMTVSRLRRALGDEGLRIETVRGRGYRLREE
jgi:DNA-binding response OmpR family regulator